MKKPKSKLNTWQSSLKTDPNAKCFKCGAKVHLTIDHILPVHFLDSLNLMTDTWEWEDNFEIMCYACNRLKGGSLDLSHPKTMRLLKEAIRIAEEQIMKKPLSEEDQLPLPGIEIK